MAKTLRRVIIFGGTGFVGRYIVRELVKLDYQIRVYTRLSSLGKATELKVFGNLGQIEIILGSLENELLIEESIRDCDVVINLLGALSANKETLYYLFVIFAERLARIVNNNNVSQFIHFSYLGVGDNSKSNYARYKLEGEEKIKKFRPNTIIIRPSLIFGPEDQFFNKFARLSKLMPILPLIGGGKAILQPVYVDDVAKLVAKIVDKKLTNKKIYKIGGPKLYDLKTLFHMILNITHNKCWLPYIPYSLAYIIGYICEFKIVSLMTKPLVGSMDPLITRDLVNILKDSNKKIKYDDLEKAGIRAIPLENVLTKYLFIYKRKI